MLFKKTISRRETYVYCMLNTCKNQIKSYFGNHWKSKEEANNANNYSNLFPVGQQFFLPIVDNSSYERFNTAKLSVNAKDLNINIISISDESKNDSFY